MLHSYKDSEKHKIIFDIRCKVKYNKSTTETRKEGRSYVKQVHGNRQTHCQSRNPDQRREPSLQVHDCLRPSKTQGRGESRNRLFHLHRLEPQRRCNRRLVWQGRYGPLVGAVHIYRYEKDGQKRLSTEVKVEEIHFSGGKKRENTAPTANRYDNPYIGTENDPLF